MSDTYSDALGTIVCDVTWGQDQTPSSTRPSPSALSVILRNRVCIFCSLLLIDLLCFFCALELPPVSMFLTSGSYLA